MHIVHQFGYGVYFCYVKIMNLAKNGYHLLLVPYFDSLTLSFLVLCPIFVNLTLSTKYNNFLQLVNFSRCTIIIVLMTEVHIFFQSSKHAKFEKLTKLVNSLNKIEGTPILKLATVKRLQVK